MCLYIIISKGILSYLADKAKCLATFGWMIESKHIWRQDQEDLMWSSHSRGADKIWIIHLADGLKVERQENEVSEELIS